MLRDHEWDNGGDGKTSSSRVWQSAGRLRKASGLDSALSPYHILSFSAALLVQPRCSVFPGKVLSAGNRGRFGSQMEMTWGMKWT